MKLPVFIFFILSVILTSFSCDKNPDLPNPEELITTLIYTLTPVGGGPDAQLIFRDIDGDGGASPVITTDTLQSGLVYQGLITLLNESVNPVENITEEVQSEEEDHQFFFTITGVNSGVTYADEDPSGHPVGLETLFSTGQPGSGVIQVILRHMPDKNATGVSSGDITNAGGDTDIEVSLPFRVQ